MDLKQLRDGIDDIDKEILSLFMKRMELCKGVADYKKEHKMPVFQGGREQQIIDRIKALTNNPKLENGTSALFTNIMDISKILQNRTILSDSNDYSYTAPDFAGAKKIGCQGTSGANSEAAARKSLRQERIHILSLIRGGIQSCTGRRGGLRRSSRSELHRRLC